MQIYFYFNSKPVIMLSDCKGFLDKDMSTDT